MNTNELLDLLNTAGRDELTTLRGIGSALADRLVAARPFDSIESVKNVRGIGSKLLSQLSETPESEPEPFSGPEPEVGGEASEEASIEDLQEAEIEEREDSRHPVKAIQPELEDEEVSARQAVQAPPDMPEPGIQERRRRWTILITSAVTALVAILLTLAILGGINGSVKFATDMQSRALQREISELNTRLDASQQDLVSLRERVGTLDGLSDRTVAMEKSQAQLSADLEEASQQVSAMQAEVIALNEKVSQQAERTQRFETFLQEMQALLEKLFGPQGETQ